MKVYVITDEFYPVYYITDSETNTLVDLPEEVVNRHHTAVKEFRESNRLIAQLVWEQRNDPF